MLLEPLYYKSLYAHRVEESSAEDELEELSSLELGCAKNLHLMERWEWRHPPGRKTLGGPKNDVYLKCYGEIPCRKTSSLPNSDIFHRNHRTPDSSKSNPSNNGMFSKTCPRGNFVRLFVLAFCTLFLGRPFGIDTVFSAYPRYYEAARLSLALIPSGTPINIRIYRLQASDADRDYPLKFGIEGTIGRNLIYLKELPCSPSTNLFCEADVYLLKEVEVSRVYMFNLTVTDTKGDRTEVMSRIDGTNGYTPVDSIFTSYTPSVFVPEDTPLQKTITSLVVRKSRSVSFIDLSLQGPTSMYFSVTGRLVSADEVKGSITLQRQLDYETINLHDLTVCAMNPYTDEQIDTRNIACVDIAVAVTDVQDMPPVFININPVTRIPPEIQPGDVLVQFDAKDGDQGTPRPIRFTLQPASSDYANFFKIDSFNGSVVMTDTVTKLMEKMVTMEPILLTVTADEVETAVSQYPAKSTQIEVAFVLVDSDLPLPKFVYEKYKGEIRENSPPDSQVYFASPFLSRVSLEDKGVKGIFSLSIEGDNGIFTVTPSIIRDDSDFVIAVKNNQLLDYEARKNVDFKLVARPVTGARQTSSTAEVSVKILDVNDNAPVFTSDLYQVSMYENVTAGTSVLKVEATDVDSGVYGSVRYTRLTGMKADRLSLDPVTGVITIATNNGDFDIDHGVPEFPVTVEARDEDGAGFAVMARILFRLMDVNDNAPIFKSDSYSGVLEPNFQSLREAIIVSAYDEDYSAPNNQVEYSIDRSRDSQYFTINQVTGVITVKPGVQLPQLAARRETAIARLDDRTDVSRRRRQVFDVNNSDFFMLSVRATDLGLPPLSSAVFARIYRKEFVEQQMTFLVPMGETEARLNENGLKQTLNALTGGTVDIQRFESYSPGFLKQPLSNDKSYVVALVRSRVNAIVDVQDISNRLTNHSNAPLLTKAAEQEQQITDLESARTSYMTLMILLLLVLIAIVCVLIGCCICPACPLYRGRKNLSMVSDENGEGISYIRTDEYGNPRVEQDRIWWDYLPNWLTDLFLSCGCQRPDTLRYTNSSRLAWSADPRQRYWNGNAQGPEPGLVETNNVTRRPQRDMMHVEDFETAGLHRQNNLQSVNLQNANVGQYDTGDVRRLFVLQDSSRNLVGTDRLPEGETFVVEDMGDTPRNIHLHENTNTNANGQTSGTSGYVRNQGNAETLRLHGGPQDVALLTEQLRRSKRAGVEPGGTQHSRKDDGGGGGSGGNAEGRRRGGGAGGGGGEESGTGSGGVSSRYVDGQSVGVTPRGEYYEDYTNSSYVHGQAPDGRRRKPDDTIIPKLRIKTPEEEDMMDDIEEHMQSSQSKAPHAYRHSRPNMSQKDASDKDYHDYMHRAPNSYGYQHTKASILRYESNMAKLEEDVQKEAEKDPLYQTFRKNSAVQREARRAAAYAAEDDSLETSRTLSQAALELRKRRDTVGHTFGKPELLERSGSVPNIQTELEREAARRGYSRRGSLAEEEYYSDGDRRDERRPILKKMSKDGDKTKNLSDDAKSKSAKSTRTVVSGEMTMEQLKALEEEMKKDSEEGDENSKVATDRSRRKRNQMTEKKSIFTIAYNDMQTKQLRPDSAAPDP